MSWCNNNSSYNLQIGQGETFNLSLNLTTNSGTPVDLTNCLVNVLIN